MAHFEEAYKTTRRYEGGYANDSADEGGETYRGIARKFHPEWTGWRYVDSIKSGLAACPPCHSPGYWPWVKKFNYYADSHPLLQDLVTAFYRVNFWDAYHLDEIENQQIANWAFDHAVNAGPKGIRWLQRAARVHDDGIIGPRSLAAINAADPGQLLAHAQGIAIDYRLERVRNRPDQKRFLRAWLARDGLDEEQIDTVMATV